MCSSDLPYDSEKDITPITQVATQPFVFTAHPSLGVNNMKELVALAKAKPGYIRYGSGGAGGASHLGTELLRNITGIDLAHVGMRYGDEMVAIVGGEEMEAVKAQDEERLALACEGRTEDFFDLVKPEQDRLKWCGLSPLYTFLNVLPDARGEVLRYDQWNIDEQSVVSFTAMEFHERS